MKNVYIKLLLKYYFYKHMSSLTFTKMIVFFLLLCGIYSQSTKFCINNCSNHGKCNANGVCECYSSSTVTSDNQYPLYGGADCSISIISILFLY